jgi:truncated hemoglobin YjbI
VLDTGFMSEFFHPGHPALIGRHGPFTVNEPAAERWLQHMQAALNVVNEIDADSKKRMFDFFK